MHIKTFRYKPASVFVILSAFLFCDVSQKFPTPSVIFPVCHNDNEFSSHCSLGDKVQLKKTHSHMSTDSLWYLTKDHSVDDHLDIVNDTLQPTVKHMHAIEHCPDPGDTKGTPAVMDKS